MDDIVKNTNYHEEQNRKNILKLREIMNTLPAFCRSYFNSLEDYTSSRTRLAYAYDIRVFFEYLHECNKVCAKMNIVDYQVDILEHITRQDIQDYMLVI